MTVTHPDIVALERALEANEEEARVLVSGLTGEQGTWNPAPGSWSVAECLDHMAAGNTAYLTAMEGPATRALAKGRLRRGPAVPGLFGGWVVRSMEPAAKSPITVGAPRAIRPRPAVSLRDGSDRFLTSNSAVLAFLRTYADLDLAGVMYWNPLFTGLRFSLATGLHVLAAHGRRHLQQAWRVRRAGEQSGDRAWVS